ncbi:MAG: 6-carboxytetrahydropterin synthase QueD [Nitrospirota bacterium]
MYELRVETKFSSAHQLRGYKGECERLHGHNYKVEVYVIAERLNEIDIAIDFHELKKLINEVIEPLDHSFLNDIFPFTEKNPSSENIAKWIYDSLNKKLLNDNVRLSAVTVWESETTSATYFED